MSAERLPAYNSESTHPADVLAREHEVLMAVLAALDSEARRLRRGAPMRAAWWTDVILFLEQFGDRCHHFKEERHLFPALRSAGSLPESFDLAQLCHEHEAERAMLRAMHDAVESGAGLALADAADGFRRLLAGHIVQENSVLLELLRARMPEPTLEAIWAGFDEAQNRTKHLHSELLALARSLCRTAGVPYELRPERRCG